jgi:hypothetical protein
MVIPEGYPVGKAGAKGACGIMADHCVRCQLASATPCAARADVWYQTQASTTPWSTNSVPALAGDRVSDDARLIPCAYASTHCRGVWQAIRAVPTRVCLSKCVHEVCVPEQERTRRARRRVARRAELLVQKRRRCRIQHAAEGRSPRKCMHRHVKRQERKRRCALESDSKRNEDSEEKSEADGAPHSADHIIRRERHRSTCTSLSTTTLKTPSRPYQPSLLRFRHVFQ